MSPGMTLNSDLVAGVKKRILSSVSRKSVATSVLYRMFCRSLEVVRCRSRVSWSWLLSAVSSSLSDCNSSFEVSSSSLVDWYSSLTDKASSLIAFCSSLEISRLRMASLQLRSRGLEFLLELGDPRHVSRRSRAASPVCSCFGSSTKQISSSSSPSPRTGCTSMLNETVLPSSVIRAAGDDDARVLLTGLLDRRPQLGAHVLARHGEQIVRRMPRRHAQIAVRRPQGIEAFVLAVDQHGGRRIGLHHQPAAELGERGLARGRLALPRPRRDAQPVTGTHRESRFRPAGRDRHADRAVPAWRSTSKRPSTSPTVSELPRSRMPPSRKAKWNSEMTFACASGRR